MSLNFLKALVKRLMIVDDDNESMMIFERALPFDHQLSCTIIDYHHDHQLSFSLSLFKFFMMVDDSFSRLTTRMIVFRSAVLVITGPIAVRTAVRKHAAALFRREEFILLQVCLTGCHLVYAFLRGKNLELAAQSRDFACTTAGELSSTIRNFFGRLTI